MYRLLGAPGIALTDTTAYTTQAVVLLIIFGRREKSPVRLGDTLPRVIFAAVAGGLTVAGIYLLAGDRISSGAGIDCQYDSRRDRISSVYVERSAFPGATIG